MIIIVEGMDNAGKTTLAMKIAKQMRAVYIKVERPKKGVDLLALQHLLEVANSYSGVVVSDRHVAISEPIYGPICRGGHDLSQSDLDLCHDRMQVIIYCRPPESVLLGSLDARDQMEGVIENSEKLLRAYDQFMEDTFTEQRVLLMTYDYTNSHQSVENIVALLMEYQMAHNL